MGGVDDCIRRCKRSAYRLEPAMAGPSAHANYRNARRTCPAYPNRKNHVILHAFARKCVESELSESEPPSQTRIRSLPLKGQHTQRLLSRPRTLLRRETKATPPTPHNAAYSSTSADMEPWSANGPSGMICHSGRARMEHDKSDI